MLYVSGFDFASLSLLFLKRLVQLETAKGVA